VKTNPQFEDKTGEERDLITFKDTPMNNHIKWEAFDKTF